MTGRILLHTARRIRRRPPPGPAAFHSLSAHARRRTAEVPDERPPTDFGRLDVLGNTPVPSTAVDVCMPAGFQLNNGVKILDGDGVLLVGGEAFAWRPWGPGRRLVNAKGQWEAGKGAFGLLGLVWPRPGGFIPLSRRSSEVSLQKAEQTCWCWGWGLRYAR